MRVSNRKKWIIAAVLTLAAGVAVGALVGLPRLSGDGPIVAVASYSFEADRPRELVAWSQNVFVGRVISQSPMVYQDDVMPYTVFEVEVLENIKGDLEERVTVGQEGGYSAEARQMILHRDDQLLVAGDKYLFATRFDNRRNWHTLVPVFGDVPLHSSAEEARLVERFRRAAEKTRNDG